MARHPLSPNDAPHPILQALTERLDYMTGLAALFNERDNQWSRVSGSLRKTTVDPRKISLSPSSRRSMHLRSMIPARFSVVAPQALTTVDLRPRISATHRLRVEAISIDNLSSRGREIQVLSHALRRLLNVPLPQLSFDLHRHDCKVLDSKRGGMRPQVFQCGLALPARPRW